MTGLRKRHRKTRMNKLTTTLAGLAFAAAVSIAPASAQTFTANGPFTFTVSPTAFTVTSIPATFNPTTGPTTSGFLSLDGGTSTNGTAFTGTILTFKTGSQTLSQSVDAFVNPIPDSSNDLISGFAPATAFSSGFTFDLVGTPAAVPEASTVLSFGALLALGGLAAVRRKSAAKSVA